VPCWKASGDLFSGGSGVGSLGRTGHAHTRAARGSPRGVAERDAGALRGRKNVRGADRRQGGRQCGRCWRLVGTQPTCGAFVLVLSSPARRCNLWAPPIRSHLRPALTRVNALDDVHSEGKRMLMRRYGMRHRRRSSAPGGQGGHVKGKVRRHNERCT
jgi:hypothetical protein